MDNELAYQAVYHVRYCKPVLLCDIQSVHHARPRNGISRGGCPARCCSMYGYGFCLEQFNEGRPGLYRRASGNKRPYHSCCLCADCEVSAWDTLILSVVLFVVIPLAGGMLTRSITIKRKGKDYFDNVFLHKFDSVTTIGLLLTLVMIFSFQGNIILEKPLHIVLIAIPLVLQTFLIFAIAYIACRILKLPYKIAAPAGMIGASNFFELSVAVAIALFGTTSPAALATTVGVLTEVPVMLFLVKIANKTQGWFGKGERP